MLKSSEERHSKQGMKRELIIFAPQLLHYKKLTWPQPQSVTRSHKLQVHRVRVSWDFPLQPSSGSHTVPVDSTAAPKWKESKMWAGREVRAAPSHPQPRAAANEVSGNRHKLFEPNEVQGVIKALLSLSLTLEKLPNLFKELNSILIPCVPDKEQDSQSIGSLLGFFGWSDSGLEEREGIKS